MKITQAEGNGQGQCALCKKRGKWNVQWMCFLYKVDGKEGVYCKNCADELRVESEKDVIKRSALLDTLREKLHAYASVGIPPSAKPIIRMFIRTIKSSPSAQPERLTDDDLETIRIHLNACKEKLCNQRRWEEAVEYQRIIDRFMAFASAQPELGENSPSEQPKMNELRVKTGETCTDAISRQAAIECLEQLSACDEPFAEIGTDDETFIGKYEAITEISDLPSAQSEIIRCKDCKWFGKAGCAILIVDDSDKPTEDDYCSFAERRTDGRSNQQTGSIKSF